MDANTLERPRQERAERTRAALLDAALHEFAAHGFEGSSTRRIAALAGTHHPQINYHFESKAALWRAAVDHLFDRFDAAFEAAGAPRPDACPREAFAQAIRALVRAVSQVPELNRMMVQEATEDSERLAWIVDRHVRRRFALVAELWRAVSDERGTTHLADVDESIVYYTLVGGASLIYVNAPEARRLTGREPTDPTLVDAHADALVTMLLGPPG